MAGNDEKRLAVIEHRVDELEESSGKTLRAATVAEALAKQACADVREISDALAERPSSVDFQAFKESVRAKARRSPIPSLSEFELKGPAWLGTLKLQGYSGVTLVVALTVAAVAAVAYLILK